MTVSASQLGIKEEWLDPKKKEPIRTFGSYAEAIDAAAKDKGNELVVEFKDSSGSVHYAVVDLAPAIKRSAVQDAANYQFPPEILSALYAEDDDNKRGTVEKLSDVAVAGKSLDQEVTSVKALARTFVTPVGGRKAEGIQVNRSNIPNVERYTHNHLFVLGKVDGAIAKIDAELANALNKGDTAKVKALQQDREELVTYQKVIRAHLLIAPEQNVTIPGLEINGKPAQVGSLRRFKDDRMAILENLSRRKGELEGMLQQLPDTADNKGLRASLERQVDDLWFAIQDLETQGFQIEDAAFRIRSRIVALGDMQQSIDSHKGQLKELQGKIEAKRAELNQLKGVSSSDPTGPGAAKWKALEAEIASLEEETRQIRDKLVDELSAQIDRYEQFSSKQGVSKEAIAFLRSQVSELALADGPKLILGAIDGIQKGLADKIKAGAAIWDGISPKEGKLLIGIGENIDQFNELYQKAKSDLKALSADAAELRRVSLFSYGGKFEKGSFDLTASVDHWDPRTNKNSGVHANRIASETYHFLDGQMSTYLNPPSNPPLPHLSNWLTYAKYASAEAGRQITNLEAALSVLYTLKTFDGYATNDKDAIKALIKLMREDQMFEQSMRLAMKVGKDVTVNDMEGMLLHLISPAGGLTVDGVQFVKEMVATLNAMRNSLVGGNTIIFKNAGPTYDIFLKAEARGEDGLEALVKSGYAKKGGGTAEDPNGLVYEAFVEFKRARVLGIEAARTTDPAKRAEILAQRERALEKANFNFVSHEQWDLAETERVFRRPKVAEATAVMTDFMYVTDGRGRHKILPNGGNWADFATREGLTAITKQEYDQLKAEQAEGNGNQSGDPIVIAVREGNKTLYYKTDASKAGTIYTYFRGGLKEGKVMTESKPETYTPKYTHVVPTKMDRVEEVVTVADKVLTYTNPVYGGIKLARYLF